MVIVQRVEQQTAQFVEVGIVVTVSYSPYNSPHSSSSYNSISRSSSSGGGSSQTKTKARWSSSSSTILYTPAEIRTLTPVRDNFEKRSELPDLRDVFLCHAWDDRKGVAKELHDFLESKSVSVWFSEKDVLLGSSLLREMIKDWQSQVLDRFGYTFFS